MQPANQSAPKAHQRLMDLSERIDAYGRPAEIVDGKMLPNVKWERANIVSLRVPWLSGSGMKVLRVHRQTVTRWTGLFLAWQKLGLLDRLLTFNGAYNCRMKRGYETSTQLKDLSTHAFGAALDVNAAWNVLGSAPAKNGDRGSVADLVPTARERGFVWGGEFSRPDGMHFEIGV